MHDKHQPAEHQHYRFWGYQCIGWGAYLLFFNMIYTTLLGRFEVQIFFWNAMFVLCGWTVSVGMRYLYWYIDLQRIRLRRLILWILLVALLGTNVWFLFDQALDILVRHSGFATIPITFNEYLRVIFMMGMILFAWSVLYFGMKLWQAWIVQRELYERIALLTQQAQLQTLRYQLNPHFLFNTLNTIRALVEQDAQAARDTVLALSEFLRYTLVSGNQYTVPLRKEIEAIRHYFAIEKRRYEDKIRFWLDIEPAAEEYPVISFILPPLVENAIQNGLQTSPLPLRIQISARIVDSRLEVDVYNTGRWKRERFYRPEDLEQGRMGIENVQRRMAISYPQEHSFQVCETDRGMQVQLKMSSTPQQVEESGS